MQTVHMIPTYHGMQSVRIIVIRHHRETLHIPHIRTIHIPRIPTVHTLYIPTVRIPYIPTVHNLYIPTVRIPPTVHTPHIPTMHIPHHIQTVRIIIIWCHSETGLIVHNLTETRGVPYNHVEDDTMIIHNSTWNHVARDQLSFRFDEGTDQRRRRGRRG
jgi:hypothetical protein